MEPRSEPPGIELPQDVAHSVDGAPTLVWQAAWLLLPAIALIWGWFMPAFYDWTGSDQSRMPWIVPAIGGAILAFDCAVWLWLVWLHKTGAERDCLVHAPMTFGIRHWFIAMLLVALLLAIFMQRQPIFAILLMIGTVIYSVYELWIRPGRWKLVNMLACQYLPFIWLLVSGQMSIELLMNGSGLPALFPTLYFEQWAQQGVGKSLWFSIALTAMQILLGIWLARGGTKRLYAYLLFILTQSLFGSFVLHALVRA